MVESSGSNSSGGRLLESRRRRRYHESVRVSNAVQGKVEKLRVLEAQVHELHSARLRMGWQCLGRLSSLSIVVSLLLLTRLHGSWAIEASEYEIKAAYLYNFGKFTEWPSIPGNPPNNRPIYLCVTGDDPFKGELDKIVTGKTVQGRPLEVRHLGGAFEIDSCDLLYVSEDAGRSVLTAALKAAKAKRVLCVGDAADFIEMGGSVRLFKDRGKVTFEVSLPAIQQAGLKMDARVLNLAARIRR